MEVRVYQPALLALEDGSCFYGESIGSPGVAVGEVVFNTAMTGYQEILSDPSYCRQLITFTAPHIGIVGVNPDDEESSLIHASGMIIRDLSASVSNWRSRQTLAEYLAAHGTVAIAGIDTRTLTRQLRDQGVLRGCLMSAAELCAEEAVALARGFPGLQGLDLASEVTTREQYHWQQRSWVFPTALPAAEVVAADLHVVAYDFGVKKNILRLLVDRGCRVTVVPAETPASDVFALAPDGVFLSNGPGDPEPCRYAIAAIEQFLRADMPLFGICLGYQLLALASGAATEKMKFGHHGANHPVEDLVTRQVLITSQNHGFAVSEQNLPDCLMVTHRSLFDNSLQGIHHRSHPAFGFQGHPEASPGPHDAAALFDQFVALMKDRSE